MRRAALLLILAALAGCGGTSSTGSFGDVSIALDSTPDANDAGLYLAAQRGYDEAEGVTFKVEPSGTANTDLTFVTDAQLKASKDLVGVMAIVQPDKLIVAASRDDVDENRGMVAAAVRALQRGYQQAQIEPDEAVAAMQQQVSGLSTSKLTAQLGQVSPTWSAGAPFLGALPPGREFDRSIARAQLTNQ